MTKANLLPVVLALEAAFAAFLFLPTLLAGGVILGMLLISIILLATKETSTIDKIHAHRNKLKDKVLYGQIPNKAESNGKLIPLSFKTKRKED